MLSRVPDLADIAVILEDAGYGLVTRASAEAAIAVALGQTQRRRRRRTKSLGQVG